MWQRAESSWAGQMLAAGKLDADALAMLTLQMYHYVKLTVPVFEHARTLVEPDDEHDALRRVLDYFIHDEDGHDRVALRDLSRLGYDPDACRGALPLPTTLNLQAANLLAVDTYGPYYLLGETYATETVGAKLSQAIADAYAAHPEAKDGIKFYELHGEADVEHAARSEEVVRHYLPLPGRRRPIVLGCLTAWKNLTMMANELQQYALYPREFQLPPRRHDLAEAAIA
jgi:hypothetical protein